MKLSDDYDDVESAVHDAYELLAGETSDESAVEVRRGEDGDYAIYRLRTVRPKLVLKGYDDGGVGLTVDPSDPRFCSASFHRFEEEPNGELSPEDGDAQFFVDDEGESLKLWRADIHFGPYLSGYLVIGLDA
jgi:hypothetical protein